MQPYYQDNWVTIYHGDCREILPELPSADLVLTDPPYNVGKNYGLHNDSMEQHEYISWCSEWFSILKEKSPCIVITVGITNLPMWLIDIERTHKIIAWVKENQCSRNYIGKTSGFNIWEPVLVYGSSKKCVPRDSFNIPIGLQSNIGDHPCPKPPRAWEWLLNNFTDHGDTVLDPFLGSGTTTYCAKKLGRKSIGIEINEKYCEIAAKRCQQTVMNFAPPEKELVQQARF